MRNIPTKSAGDTLPSDDFNAQESELENTVLSADFTPDPAGGPDTNLFMQAQAIAAYANAGWFYQDSGSANAYVISVPSNLKRISKYYSGTTVLFKAGNSNTGASTINVNSLGVKNLTTNVGSALANGAIIAGSYVLAVYNLSNDRFEIIKSFKISDNLGTYNRLLTDQKVTSSEVFKGLTSGSNFATDRYDTNDNIDLVNSVNIFFRSGDKLISNDGVGGFFVQLFTGTGVENAVTGVGFQPDFVWIKSRTSTRPHQLFDIIRGATKLIIPNSLNAETTVAESLKSFDSDGFTLGTDVNVNENLENFVSWCFECPTQKSTWSGGGSDPDNEYVNVKIGMSIVEYTGTGIAHAINHNLNEVPSLMIVKNLETSFDWRMYHQNNHVSSPEDYYLNLNTNAAITDDVNQWNDTAPTSDTFTVGTNSAGNENTKKQIAYLFSEVPGFSKFGVFAGNSSVNTIDGFGFDPEFVLIKRISSTGGQAIIDAVRGDNKRLLSNAFGIEDDTTLFGTPVDVELITDGFRLDGANSDFNESGSTYIYVAFGEKGIAQNMDLISKDIIPNLTARPSFLNVETFIDDVDGTAVLGTDVKIYGSGRQNSNVQPTSDPNYWTELTISDQGLIKDNIHYVIASGDITSQPDDGVNTEIRYRIKTFNDKRVYINGVEIQQN
jgi:hypothetical protein